MSWQQSYEEVIKLGVRNKFGLLESYEVSFIIKERSGKEFKVSHQARNDEWCFVQFPIDFQTYGKPGKYSWRAVVEGHIVARGSFYDPNLTKK